MITRSIGKMFAFGRDKVAAGFVRIGITPNTLTVAGLVIIATGAFFYAQGKFLWGIIIISCALVFDMFDGAVARLSDRITPFGGFLDSALDRYADIFVFGAAAWYFATVRHSVPMAVVALWALAGALVISYTRARAENIVDECRVGFWTRGERVVYLLIGSGFGTPMFTICVIALGVHWTALGRILYTRRISENPQARIRKNEILARVFYWDFKKGSVPYEIYVVAFVFTSMIGTRFGLT